MIRILASRLVQTVLVLFVASLVAFVGVYAIGEPTALYDPFIRANPELLEALRQRLGLDLPLHRQYLVFMQNLARGDLGDSWVFQEPAIQLLLARAPATLELVAAAMFISVGVGFPVGLLAGLNRGRWFATLIERLSILGYSTPTFWVGLILIYVFAVAFDILPSVGRGETVSLLGIEWSLFTLDGLAHLVLPASTIACYEIGYIARMTATMTEETLPREFIRFARAKGLSRRHVVTRHLLKNISVPLVTILVLESGVLVAGSVVTETIFGWPGVGKLIVDAVAALDRPVIVAFVLLAALFFVVLNAFADLVHAFIDPRVRAQRTD